MSDNNEDLTNICRILYLKLLNNENEKIFKAGGISLPHFNSWDEYEAFNRVIEESFASSTELFKNMPSGEITFDLPDRYLGNKNKELTK